MTDQAQKYDGEKPQIALVPPEFIIGCAHAFTYGIKKYSAFNYLKGDGLKIMRLISSLQRHLLAFTAGQDIDEESGLPHLYNASACMAMITATLREHPNNDDRYKYSSFSLFPHLDDIGESFSKLLENTSEEEKSKLLQSNEGKGNNHENQE